MFDWDISTVLYVVPHKFLLIQTHVFNIFLPADEVVEILARLKPEKYSQEFFKNYINLVLSVFYVATKDLPELKHQVCIFGVHCISVYCSYIDVHLVDSKII